MLALKPLAVLKQEEVSDRALEGGEDGRLSVGRRVCPDRLNATR
jgi:hypothetical protein